MIRNLRLQNFKSFVDETVALDSFTLIYGVNGVGKSNLTDALRFLRFIGDGRSVRDAIEGHTPGAFNPAITASSGIRGGAENISTFGSTSSIFTLEALLETELGAIIYQVSVDADEYKVVHEQLCPQDPSLPAYIYSTDPESAPIKQALDSPVLKARYYTTSRGPNPARSFSAHEFILQQFTGRKAETAWNQRFADAVRATLRGITPLELRPEILRQYSPLGRIELGEHGENFAAVVWLLLTRAEIETQFEDNRLILSTKTLDSADIGMEDSLSPTLIDAPEATEPSEFAEEARQRLQAIVSWLNQLTPRKITGFAVEFAPTNEVIFSVYEEPFARPLNSRVLSDGTLRVAALCFALLGSVQVGGGRGEQKTYVIEEIENGVNPTRAQLLLRLMQFATGGQSSNQVLATTHSPTLLDYADESVKASTLVVGWDADRSSSVVTNLEALPGLAEAEETARLSELLAEGWMQLAADR